MSTQSANLQVDVMAFLLPKDHHARLLRPGETIPASLNAGFDMLGKIDPNWIWILESQGEIRGILVASDCHGCAFVWRLVVSPGMGNVAVIRLLRRFAMDIRERGLKGYLTLLSAENDTETRLKGIVEKLGGKSGGQFTLMASWLPKENI